jgi:hypothetical protein
MGPRGSTPPNFEASVTEATREEYSYQLPTNNTGRILRNHKYTMALIASLLNLVGIVFLAHA